MTPAPDPTTDPAALRAENARLRATVDELLAAVAQLRNTVAKQQAHIDRLVRLTFGRRSERLAGPTLFDGVAGPDPVVANPPPSPPTDAPVSPPRRRGHGRRPHPADLPRERVEVDLTEAEKACPCCGERRVRIGTDVSERLDYRPASLFVRQVARATYACRHCERRGVDPHVIRPPLPAEPIPRGAVAAGLLAHVIVAKFCDHLPLYRQESILGRLGWEVSRSTLCDHLRACAAVLRPLYRLMIDRVKQSYALHADDTPVTLLRPRRTAFAWAYVGDAAHPYTVFDLTAGRSQEYPAAFLAGYTGFVHADAYAGYNPVHGDGRRHVGCWMHARRGFFDARDSDVRSIEALARIRTLYAVERRAKELALTDDARAAYRREHARPILDAFADWLADERRTALPKSAFGQAVHYAINQWPSLTRYVGDSRLAIDNSPAEQAIRPLAVGRANWLHIGGDTGLSSAAVLVSVTASAKRHHVNPWAYLRDVLIAIPARGPNADLSDLLPDAWRRSHADPLPVTAG
jgi:transposase